ncbi:MAG: hypothetical protein J6Q60_05725 [Bacteroidaceae bacterium]|nr:hypothetical protein [Bacteroidaceae bacterium]
MTCREKLKLEHPELVDMDYIGGCHGCPNDYGYLPRHEGCSEDPGMNCTECWDREIPGTITKKENDIMPTHDINHTKKTKAELIEEIECAEAHIRAMETQIANLERYKQYEDMANEAKAMHTAFMNSGFTNEQAFDMIKMLTQSVVPAALRGMRV